MKTTRPYLVMLVLTIFIAFSIVYIACEAENPGEPVASRLPDTHISEAITGNVTTIIFYATDDDLTSWKFAYKWDTDVDWSFTGYSIAGVDTVIFYETFTNQNEVKTFYVKAIDYQGNEDPYPAELTLSPNNILPTTTINTGPQFSDVVGTEVTFTFTGNDIDEGGFVVAYQYTMDDLNSWQEIPATNTEATFSGLADGAHTFYVRSVDNLGGIDSTPAQVAFITKVPKEIPDILFLTYFEDGDSIFSNVEIPIEWSCDYLPNLYNIFYSFSLNDPTNYDSTSNPLASNWQANSNFNIPANWNTSGNNTFYVKIKLDTLIAINKISFYSFNYNPTNGILLIDDFSWVPDGYLNNAHMDSLIEYGFMNGYNFTQRENNETAIKLADLANYSTVILYGDGGYTNSNSGELFELFALVGGNLMLCSYYLKSWSFYSTFNTYGISLDPLRPFPPDGPVCDRIDGVAGTAYENWHINLPPIFDFRSYEPVYSIDVIAKSIFNVQYLSSNPRSCGTRSEMPNGNIVIVIGQSLPFMDQTLQDTKDFGDYVLGTEFGESRSN